MEKKTRLEFAKADIIEHFNNLHNSVFTQTEIDIILSENRNSWRLAQSTTTHKFIDFMLNATKLKRAIFKFPSRAIHRYIWEKASIYELAMSLNPASYFTHFTAMYLHNLTEQIPKAIYLNIEQPPKRFQEQELEQGRIDAAFKRTVRVSQQVASYEDRSIRMLSGMHTGRQGVFELEGPDGEKLNVTGIERTLIDIAVRPIYSGGVAEVLKAYDKASSMVSVNKLKAMLKKINYTYPYHQVIGFYLEKAKAYDESQISLLRKVPMKYDFYLTHQMVEKSYSREWRLYFPKGF